MMEVTRHLWPANSVGERYLAVEKEHSERGKPGGKRAPTKQSERWRNPREGGFSIGRHQRRGKDGELQDQQKNSRKEGKVNEKTNEQGIDIYGRKKQSKHEPIKKKKKSQASHEKHKQRGVGKGTTAHSLGEKTSCAYAGRSSIADPFQEDRRGKRRGPVGSRGSRG